MDILEFGEFWEQFVVDLFKGGKPKCHQDYTNYRVFVNKTTQDIYITYLFGLQAQK